MSTKKEEEGESDDEMDRSRPLMIDHPTPKTKTLVRRGEKTPVKKSAASDTVNEFETPSKRKTALSKSEKTPVKRTPRKTPRKCNAESSVAKEDEQSASPSRR